MVSMQKAQTGARVYRGVGQSPNMGQVSAKGAQGYIQREQRKNGPVRPIGNDGKSNSRSGVAAAALKRQGKTATVRGSNGKPAGQGKPKPSVGAPVGAPAAPPPQVRVSDTGLLELPYDQNYAADQYASVEEANQSLLELQMEEQQNNLEYAQATQQATTAHEQNKKNTLSGAGGAGTVFSSQYGNQVATNATNYTNTLSDLTNKNAQFKSEAALRRAGIESSLARQLAQATQEYGDDLGEDAGELGYDTTPVPVNAAAASIRKQTKKSPAKKAPAKKPNKPQAVIRGSNGKPAKKKGK